MGLMLQLLKMFLIGNGVSGHKNSLRIKLKKLNFYNKERNKIANNYYKKLDKLKSIKLPKLERFSHALVGVTMFVCGCSITLLGL